MKDAGIEESDLVQVRLVGLGTSPPDGAIALAEVGILQQSERGLVESPLSDSSDKARQLA